MSGTRGTIEPNESRALPPGPVDHAVLDGATQEDIARHASDDDAETMQDIARFVRRVRGRLGLTPAEFARRIDVPHETIRNWEQGKRGPTILAAQHCARHREHCGAGAALSRIAISATISPSSHRRQKYPGKSMHPMQELEPIVKAAIFNLRSGRLEREEEIKLAVILPILNALDWNPADPGSLRPEYPAGPGRVDYALFCHGRPQVFVEAKRRGALDARAEAQLFGYAANNGVPLLVLSDGLCWDFYLSMADGRPEERRFHRLELRSEEMAADPESWSAPTGG